MPKAGSIEKPTDDKKEPIQKNAHKKKITVTGIWPCKINGCNKQFAREADLKRHQRTTKLHSMPSFSCPQCDAAFTRTDALRRHQKSRHNGVVMEAPDRDAKDDQDDDVSSGSQTNSRSGTPSSKGKAKESQLQPPPQPPPRGPSSYYRPHTLTTTASPYLQQTLGTTPPYPPPGLPTPVGMNMVTALGYPHAWPNGIQPGMQPPAYPQINYSPYYRHDGIFPPPSGTSQQPNEQRIPPTSTNPCASNNTIPPSKSPDMICDESSHSNPSLNMPGNTTELTEEQVLEAAVQAVLEAEAEHSKARGRIISPTTPIASYSLGMGNGAGTLGAHPDGISDSLDIGTLHGYGMGRPEELQHILTEDGEPMLNPAELLTQESLASPPPV